jgi:hypothetical protein
MSRKLTDDELLELADTPDCWTPSWPAPPIMATLRAMVRAATDRADLAQVSLFRAGGYGAPAIWLRGEDIKRLHQRLAGHAVTPRASAPSR